MKFRIAQLFSLGVGLLLSGAACSKSEEKVDKISGGEQEAAAPAPSPPEIFSAFGAYTQLPPWSSWCGAQTDEKTCATPLGNAVSQPTPESRPTVRAHGWRLWAAANSELALSGFRNDAKAQKTNLQGVKGCWETFPDGSPACSGSYPIWLSWPNTGKPYRAGGEGARGALGAAAVEEGAAKQDEVPLLVRRRWDAGEPAKSLAAVRKIDPQKTQTVNTPGPTYDLPPLVLSKQCGITKEEAIEWSKEPGLAKLKKACESSGVFCPYVSGGKDVANICDGVAFVNQGDVMIATESISREGYDEVQKARLYDSKVLAERYGKEQSVSKDIGSRFVSTKHMYWPVKGCKPGAKLGEEGCRIRYGALPPWIPKNFKRYSYATNADYLGYEEWGGVVAIDSCGGKDGCPEATGARLELAYVKDKNGKAAKPLEVKKPDVYSVKDFVHVQVSEEALSQRFSATDRALLDQATIWAYGDASNGFEAGDFLVTVAMHVNTKEISSWAFNSVWWTPRKDTLEECPLSAYDNCFGQSGAYAATSGPGERTPNQYSGLKLSDVDDLDQRVGTTWRDHYLLIDSYGIGYEIDGTAVDVKNHYKGKPPAWATTGPTGKPLQRLPVAMNVYIEPVIHPIGTDCQNCHQRAGIPSTRCDDYSQGCGRTSQQTAQCPDLLASYGYPYGEGDAKNLCMSSPWAWHDEKGNHCRPEKGTLCKGDEAYPILDTDLIWFLADGHIQGR